LSAGAGIRCTIASISSGHANARLGRNLENLLALDADQIDNLLRHPLDIRRRQVDFIDHRNDLQPRFDCQVQVGDGLRLDALRGIDHQQRALAGGQRPGDLVAEVHVAGRIDKIERVLLAIVSPVEHLHGMALDGDATFALEIHAIEHLRGGHLVMGKGFGRFEKPVGKCRFTVVDMGDNAEIPDQADICS